MAMPRLETSSNIILRVAPPFCEAQVISSHAMNSLLTSSLATYTLLSFAMISLWLRKKPLIFGSLLGLTCIAGLLAGHLHPSALLGMALFAGVAQRWGMAQKQSQHLMWGLLVVLLSMLLWFHKVPGFANALLAKNLVIGQHTQAFNFFLNIDKSLIGLFILGFGPIALLKTRAEAWQLFKQTLPMAALSIFMIVGLACLTGHVQYDFKINRLLLIFALNNLLFVCIAEEALCRGLVQNTLSQMLAPYRYGQVLALLAASLFFGLLHQGDWLYILLATIAGLCYGLVYQKTQRIEASILTHFLLNMVHFVGFSYPALA